MGEPGVRGGDPRDLGDVNDTGDVPNADDNRSGGEAKSCDTGDNAAGGDNAVVGAGDVRVNAPPMGTGVVRVGVGPTVTGPGAGVVRLTAPCVCVSSSTGGIKDNDSGKPGMID